jgi:hypothetical protein
MTEADLAFVESELQVTLPEAFRQFMLQHGQELRRAENVLRYDVVLSTDAEAVVKLNREIREFGIEVGIHATPAPWPLEYLALNDNTGGDYECVKLSEATCPIYLFDHEEGRFHRKFKTLEDYRKNLAKRVAKFEKSGPGKSDPELLEAFSLTSDDRAFHVGLRRVQPPVTPAKLKAAGVDTESLQSAFAGVLEVVTGIKAESWRMGMKPGKYPVQVQVTFATEAEPVGPLEPSYIQMLTGDLMVVFKLRDRASAPPDPPVDWRAFEDALCTVIEVAIGKPVRLVLGRVSGSFEEYGNGCFKCKYQLTHRMQ